MTQVNGTAITEWLKEIADRKKEREASCHDDESTQWFGNPGNPINTEVRKEIEEARRSGYTRGFAKKSAAFGSIKLDESLDEWRIYGISALCSHLAGLWVDNELDIHNNPDKNVVRCEWKFDLIA